MLTTNKSTDLSIKPTDVGAPAWASNQPAQPLSPSFFAVIPPTASFDGRGGDDNRDSEACRLVLVNLSAFLDDELDADQQVVIERHLVQCSACSAHLADMEETDGYLEREWRDNAPLPSSSQFKHSIDSIMDAIPQTPAKQAEFMSKRVHSKTRWMRFATGMTGAVVFGGMLWGSYQVGYENGRSSGSNGSLAPKKSLTSSDNHPYGPDYVSLPYSYSSPNFRPQYTSFSPPPIASHARAHPF